MSQPFVGGPVGCRFRLTNPYLGISYQLLEPSLRAPASGVHT